MLNKFIKLLNGDDSIVFCEFIKSLSPEEQTELVNTLVKLSGGDECRLSFIQMKIEDHFNVYKSKSIK